MNTKKIKEIPPHDRICRAFAYVALRTWNELKDFKELGEESITDYRILQLKRACPNEVRIIKFDKRKREPETGADWEWWFGSSNNWFGMRVQAKRLDVDKLEYKYLDHTIGKTGILQINRLIADAKLRNLYPMYCFYNYWSSENPAPDWNCGTFIEQKQLWGATVSDAVKVKSRVDSKVKNLQELASISKPLLCLACCEGFSKETNPTLSQRARSIAIALSGDADSVPVISQSLPSYVEQGLNGQIVDAPDEVFNLDGILVIDENSDTNYKMMLVRTNS